VIVATIATNITLFALCIVLLVENRRLTNLVIAKNPETVLAAERVNKQKKERRNDDKPHSAWANPSEAVGP
jgi:hypothetical protein